MIVRPYDRPTLWSSDLMIVRTYDCPVKMKNLWSDLMIVRWKCRTYDLTLWSSCWWSSCWWLSANRPWGFRPLCPPLLGERRDLLDPISNLFVFKDSIVVNPPVKTIGWNNFASFSTMRLVYIYLPLGASHEFSYCRVSNRLIPMFAEPQLGEARLLQLS